MKVRARPRKAGGGRNPRSPGGGRRKVRLGAAADPTGSQGQPAGPELQRPRENGPPRDLARRSTGRGQGRAEPPRSWSHERGRHLQRAAPHPLPQARRPALPQPGRLRHGLVGKTRGLAGAGGSEAPAHSHAAARQVGRRRGTPRICGPRRYHSDRTDGDAPALPRRVLKFLGYPGPREKLSWTCVRLRNSPLHRPASPPIQGVLSLSLSPEPCNHGHL